MAKSSSDTSIAPPLTAFGGWTDADWFSSSLLSDPEIVAFELPRLPGQRKQSFHIVDRTLTRSKPETTSKPGAPRSEPARPPRRPAGKLASLIDALGAVRAVAGCRSKIFFESSPVLFFAEVPSARLKQRAANKLRRDLVEIGITACVLRVCPDLTTMMFWLAAETSITDFVRAFGPDLDLHAAFDEPRRETTRRPSARETGDAEDAPARRARDREAKLLQRIAVLQGQVDALTRSQSALGAMEQLGLDDARLKSMLRLLHPDRHQGSEAATEAAKWLNGLRDLLKGKTAE